MLIEKNMYHISIDTDLIKVQILSFQGSGHGVNEIENDRYFYMRDSKEKTGREVYPM